LEITRTGGSDASWIQFDYLKAEVDTDLCADPLCAFAATTTEAGPGQEITLNWIASPTSSLVLNPGAINVTPLTTNGLGSIKLVPDGTTTYSLTATKGQSVQTRELTVNVPLILNFSANRTSLSLNESATLLWKADPKATLTIDQGVGSVNAATDAFGGGRVNLTPGNQERVYTLTATRGASTTTSTLTVGYAEFGTIWKLGADDNGTAEFVQEAGSNPLPGSPIILDDDYYFLGAYPDPIGTLYSSENPATNFERAVTGGSTTTRVHFTLTEPSPAPNSRVRIRPESQSPFTGWMPLGALGIHMPGGPAYDGFGQSLSPAWKRDQTSRLHAAFDFRCGEVPAGGGGEPEGTWRFYLGHGAGTSAAVELFWSGSELFRIDGDRKEVVAPLRRGQWYQVGLVLDLKARRYEATLRGSGAGETSAPVVFSGALYPGWDGAIDDVFIDSYGHRPGPKPALDADNFAVQEAPLPIGHSGLAVAVAENPGAGERRRQRLTEIEARLKTLQEGAESAARELEQLLVEGPFPLAYGVSEGTPRDAVVQVRGEPDQPGQRVRRGALSALGLNPMAPATATSGRLELARWLTDPANPLPARVMVNRIWQQHFGRGLVESANDFGLRGQAPSHPELLDHLTSEFRRTGGSIKALHRLILNSAVYRQRSEPEPWMAEGSSVLPGPETASCPVDDPAAAGAAGAPGTSAAIRGNSSARDPGDGFSPFPRRRLGAEETRDAILEACGDLDLSVGAGHPFPSPTRWGYTQHGPYVASYEHHRRSVYLMTQRIQRHPFLALFDGADPNASTAVRRTTTVPSQALFFLNDPMVHREAEHLARTAQTGSQTRETTESDQVVWVFRRILRRSPEPAEVAEAAAFLAQYRNALKSPASSDASTQALSAWIRVLLGSNEFLTVD
jgi:hypothetical protein